MNTHIHQKFNSQIYRIKKIHSILIAISGGQDSMCLIKLIEDFNKKFHLNTKIEYIYIDHQWKKNAKYQVEHLINCLKQTNHHLSIYQIKNITLSEVAARHIRYQIIIKHAIKNNFSLIMTAHTKTDRIETFLQKLIRGTKLDGIIGLTYKRKILNNCQMVRPLIIINRTDLNWFCRKFFLPVWSDNTNYKYDINRNRLRYEFIPYLKQYYQSNIEDKINDFIQSCNIDNDYIKQSTIKLYILIRHQINIAIYYNTLKEQHIAIQNRIIQLFFFHNYNKTLDIITIDQILNIINNEYKKKLYIIYWNKLKINIYNDWLYIS